MSSEQLRMILKASVRGGYWEAWVEEEPDIRFRRESAEDALLAAAQSFMVDFETLTVDEEGCAAGHLVFLGRTVRVDPGQAPAGE